MDSAQDTLAGGLPHSEIPGSPIARISPGLFAACHVLHRLSVPRHPPDALASRLITASPSPAMPHHRRAQGQTPLGQTPCLSPQQRRAAASMKTLSLGQASGQALLAPPSGASIAGASRLAKLCFADRGPSASVTSQLSLHPSINPAAVARGGVAQSSPNVVRPGAADRQHLSVQPRCTCRRQKLKLWQSCALGGGGERVRTDDLLLAKQALSRLSYTPAPGIRRQRSGSRIADPR
jgi:hypothetical protein